MTSNSTIVIIDYGMGNLRSVQKKFNRLHTDVCVSSDVAVIARADKLVLPGVGHFATGVKNLRDSGIWDVLNQKVLYGKTPILGICLGMQLMAHYGEEGETTGLGWFDADVLRFRVSDRQRYKIPHIGWNTTEQVNPSPLFTGISASAMFYFVHAYHVVCRHQSDVVATTNYDYSFVSVMARENIYGTQFHPEKSHDWGERLIENFIGLPLSKY